MLILQLSYKINNYKQEKRKRENGEDQGADEDMF